MIGTGRATGAGQNDGAAVYDAINSESNAYGSQHRFKIAGTDCFTIGYNGAKGYVGINDTVPYPDAVSGNTVDTCLELGGSMTGNDKASVIKLNGRASGSVNKCQLQWAGANNRFDITVNGSTAFQIQANKDVEITDGNLVIGTSGHGIDFSATSNSSVGSNIDETLTDYEQGTWTPQLIRNGGSSYFSVGSGNRYGYYKRVGNLLFLSFYWYNPSLTDSSGQYWIIQGLPFGVKTSSGGAYQFLPGGYYYMMGQNVGDSAAYGSYRWQSNANGLVLYSASNNINASGTVEFSGCGTLCI